MLCSKCRHENVPGWRFCIKCGYLLLPGGEPDAQTLEQYDNNRMLKEPGRSTVILALGVLSIVSLGPFLGIPAWVMGKKDLEKIRAGMIDQSQQSLTKTGMILGIVGTFFSVFTIILVGMMIAVGISLINQQSNHTSREVESNKVNILYNLNQLANDAWNCRTLFLKNENGEKTYKGYIINPKGLWGQANTSAVYEIVFQTDTSIKFKARSKQVAGGTIEVTYDSQGHIIEGPAIYGFDEREHKKEKLEV